MPHPDDLILGEREAKPSLKQHGGACGDVEPHEKAVGVIEYDISPLLVLALKGGFVR